MICSFVLAAVFLFYITPLFDDKATIHWDTADLHYSCQKYFSDMLWAGKLPFWTADVFSGMPFLADIQVGAWYPLNWPFFAGGITPRALEWELALHALVACLGAFVLARELLHSQLAALFTAFFYGLSGFFAGHSSHLGLFQTAALFPWLLWTSYRALNRQQWRWIVIAGLTGGCLVLAGHFQCALYSFFGLALFFATHLLLRRNANTVRSFLILLVTIGLALTFSAIQTAPGLELTAQSIRAGSDYAMNTNAPLAPGALWTLLQPDHYGAITEQYHGPPDITQFYFYAGILLVPLAVAGLFQSPVRGYALGLIFPCLWYAFGPGAGLYKLVALLPGFRSVRAPVHIWFAISLGLALLAGAGIQQLRTRLPQTWIPIALLAFVFGDLWYWNMDKNPLAYARSSFEQLYGVWYDHFQQVTAGAKQQPLYRLWAPAPSSAFGPLNSSLDSRTEVTYGYNPLMLSRYGDYMAAALTNPKLLDGLSVTAKLNNGTGQFIPNLMALPRAYFPPSVSNTATAADSKARLPNLDPAKEAVAELPSLRLTQDGQGRAQITNYEDSVYRVRYSASSESLLRISTPYFPGWRAEVDGRSVRTLPVDLALIGAVVPAGQHELVLRYHSTWFLAGLCLSLFSLLSASVVLFWPAIRRRTRSN